MASLTSLTICVSWRPNNVKRIDYWKAKLKAAQAEERIRQKELNQMAKAFERALEQVDDIQKRIEDEKAKLARTE
jgi:peptidoglycan hydrolase CwlO-like protein